MGQPHKHAELIKLWAEGAEIEIKYLPNGIWHTPDVISWLDGAEYRIKPEPPKYPQTKMNGEELFDAFYDVLGHKCTLSLVAAPGVHLVVDDGFIGIANAAIARAIEDGDVVPADMLEKVAVAVRAELVAQVARYSTGCSTYINGEIDLAAIIKRVKEGK